MRPHRVRRRTRRKLKIAVKIAVVLLFVYVVAELIDLSDNPTGFVQTPYSNASSVF